MTPNSIKLISVLLLFIIGLGILNPAISFWSEDAHHLDCLEFGHVHVEADDECHGGVLLASTFLPNSEINYSDLLLTLTFAYPTITKIGYQDPNLEKYRKPPRLS